MTWTLGPQDGLNKMQVLGVLTARLLRLLAYQKISRGDIQLKAAGVDLELEKKYKAHIRKSKIPMPTLIPKKPKNLAIFNEPDCEF